jgi:predicted DNA-binding transcriptional regulator AlpA
VLKTRKGKIIGNVPGEGRGSPQVMERLLRVDEVMSICGISRSTIYKLMGEDRFPLYVKLLNTSVRGSPSAWRESEIRAWVKARCEGKAA